MIDPEKYTFVIRKTSEDEEEPFVARVIEFPYLVACGKTPEEAYEIAVETIRSFVEEKIDLPNPIPNINEFSGRVSLRIPKSLHRKLANHAEVEGVSINQYLGNILSWASENYYRSIQSVVLSPYVLGISIPPTSGLRHSVVGNEFNLINFMAYPGQNEIGGDISKSTNFQKKHPQSSEQSLDTLEKRDMVSA